MKLLILIALVLMAQVAIGQNAGGNCTADQLTNETHTQWFYGNTPAIQCVDNACAAVVPKFLEIYAESQTVNTISVAQLTDDETKVELAIDTSVLTCGSGSNEECITAGCFQLNVYTAAEWAKAFGSRTAVTADTGSTVNNFGYTIDKTFYTGSDCTADTSGSNPIYTCGFVAEYILTGIDETIGTKTFNIQLTQLGGADQITGEVAITLAAQEATIAAAQESYVRDVAQTVTGTLTISNAGTIYVGDQVDFVLTGPADVGGIAYNDRLFNTTTDITLKLVHSTDSEIIVTPKAAPENSAANEGDANTLTFSIDANYIGTYTVKVEATLTGEQPPANPAPIVPPGGNRLLQQTENLQTIVENIPLTLTIHPAEKVDNSFYIYASGVLAAILLGTLVYIKFFSTKKQGIQYTPQADIEI